MKIITILKFFLELVILSSFLSERFLYYKQFSPDKSDNKSIHHELVKGWEIDFSKVDTKYVEHHLFKLPKTKKLANGFKEYLINHFDLNTTISHQKHIHGDDTTHTYYNKVIDIDTKFKFYFLTLYDILITTLLIFSLFFNSKIGGLFYLFDISLKIFGMFYEPSFNHQFVHLFSGKAIIFVEYLLKENPDSLKIINFMSTVFYFLCQFIFGKNKVAVVVVDEKKENTNKDVKQEKKSELGRTEVNAGDVDGQNKKVRPKIVPLEKANRDKKRDQSPGRRDRRVKEGNF